MSCPFVTRQYGNEISHYGIATAALGANSFPSRDASIDGAVLDATLHRLARDGFAGLSLASVAADAGTSRPAIYRRRPDKESLVVDVIARLGQAGSPAVGGSPCDELVATFEHFRPCITETAALPVAGLMLGDDSTRQYARSTTTSVVGFRIRACLQRAIDDG
jgi:AcrR family transcriptional regulator